MGGGLMQLVAYGAHDIYLTGNPQITFFKVVPRAHRPPTMSRHIHKIHHHKHSINHPSSFE